jgi:hypothetical protein
MISARQALRAMYDAVIEEINSARGSQQLTNAFYSKVGGAIFDACHSALEHSAASQEGVKVPLRLHVVSAPMGTGKTSFAVAFITALVRISENAPGTPRGCVFLVEQMTKADEMYRELSALLPGRVAVWTTDHSVTCTKPTKVLSPAARFHVDELENYAVAIVTHAFYKGSRGHKARNVFHDGVSVPRALTVIDEQPDDVEIFDVTCAAATAVLEAVQQDVENGKAVEPYVHTLVKFMADKALGSGSLEKPSDDATTWSGVASGLEWFNTSAAREYVKNHSASIQGLEAVFGFARAMASGYAFIARYSGDAPHFVGYQNNLTLLPGMVLLDATADIDGITQLCPWRSHTKVPQASYANLSIVHVKSCTTQRLSKVLKLASNRHRYVDWMLKTILAQTEPAQRALVVCTKSLFDNQNVPNWPERDERFQRPDAYIREYGWDLEGRKLCATHWGGFGIGANTWQDAEVVFLFDEFFVPRRVTIARAQGLVTAKATEGALGHMKALNSKSPQVDALYDGHLLRWTKQMALRGKGRHFDEHGVCGHQKLVCTGDYERLVANAEQLFPGASITRIGDTANTYAEKFLALLSRPGLPDCLTPKCIGEQIGTPWSAWGKNVLKRSKTQACMKALGWRYVPERGRGGGKFLRDTVARLTVHREYPTISQEAREVTKDPHCNTRPTLN